MSSRPRPIRRACAPKPMFRRWEGMFICPDTEEIFEVEALIRRHIVDIDFIRERLGIPASCRFNIDAKYWPASP